jgi:hypothetical protein
MYLQGLKRQAAGAALESVPRAGSGTEIRRGQLCSKLSHNWPQRTGRLRHPLSLAQQTREPAVGRKEQSLEFGILLSEPSKTRPRRFRRGLVRSATTRCSNAATGKVRPLAPPQIIEIACAEFRAPKREWLLPSKVRPLESNFAGYKTRLVRNRRFQRFRGSHCTDHAAW